MATTDTQLEGGRQTGGSWPTVLAIALLAALIEQVGHELTHAVVGLVVGKRLEMFNLFAVGSSWPGPADNTGNILAAGSAAVFNIISGFIAMVLFRRPSLVGRPHLRLFLLYLAAFSLLAGFGYLMVDPLFFDPSSTDPGDWKAIVRYLGGGWGVRLPIIAVGVAGVLWVFFWLPKAALHFVPEASQRKPVALRLLLVPFVVVCGLFTLLAIWHPLGGAGLFLIVMKYWFGYSAFFWAFFIAGVWLKVALPLPGQTPIPGRSLVWMAVAGVTLVASVVVLLPSINF